MASYRIEFLGSAIRDLRKLSSDDLPRIGRAIDSLADQPLRRGVRKLEGAAHTYRLRVGVYRIIYELDHESRVVCVQYVRHRREAYRNL